jgi:hypothetical protein
MKMEGIRQWDFDWQFTLRSPFSTFFPHDGRHFEKHRESDGSCCDGDLER